MRPHDVAAAAMPVVKAQRPIVRVALVGIVVVALWTVTALLVRLHETRRHTRAEREGSLGQANLSASRTREALAHFREAVALDPAELTYRLRLGRALIDAGHRDEASVYLRGVLRDAPVNGTANLLLARIERASGHVGDAETHYYRAIYGLWPADEQRVRGEVRLELIELLRTTADRERVRAELTQLASDFPGDLPLQLRAARYLLDLDFPDDAARLFRVVTTRFTEPGSALTGLAEAELARGDYGAAAVAAARALRRRPDDRASAGRREVAMTALALDPTQPRLDSRERARRLEVLMRLTRARLARCEPAKTPAAASPGVPGLVDRWLAGRQSAGKEDLDLGFTLVDRLAHEVVARCAPSPDRPALDLVLRKLAAADRS